MSEENAFWNYAVRIYSEPGVADLCLTLQNQYGLSVNQLLFALWLAQQGRLLPANLDDRKARKWRTEHLEPLRQLRYQARQYSASTTQKQCYQSLKQAELAAEKVEIELLYQLLECCAESNTINGSTNATGSGLAYQNLSLVVNPEGQINSELSALVLKLVDKAGAGSSN